MADRKKKPRTVEKRRLDSPPGQRIRSQLAVGEAVFDDKQNSFAATFIIHRIYHRVTSMHSGKSSRSSEEITQNCEPRKSQSAWTKESRKTVKR